MKIFLHVFIVLNAFTPFVYAEGLKDKFPLNVGTQFEYSEKDIPEICFFPIEEARWNGYELTNLDWKKLTDYQKVQFVREGALEIFTKKQVSLKLEDRLETWLDYVSLINQSLEMSEDEANKDAEFKILPFYYNVLQMRGVVVDKEGNVLKSEWEDEALNDKEAQGWLEEKFNKKLK